MTNAHRDLATPELWNRSLDRSRRRRALLPKARRENNRRKHLSAALATAVVAGPGTPIAAAQVSGDVSAAVAAESPANRAIEVREGGLPLRVGSQGELVAHGVPAILALLLYGLCLGMLANMLPKAREHGADWRAA